MSNVSIVPLRWAVWPKCGSRLRRRIFVDDLIHLIDFDMAEMRRMKRALQKSFASVNYLSPRVWFPAVFGEVMDLNEP